MATKEDILEQVVEEFLLHRGYFVQHNVKFKPRIDHSDYVKKDDSNHSDIDVIGYHPLKHGHERVIAVSCKSWQGGFRPKSIISAIEKGAVMHGRPAWKGFRELTQDKWSEAFCDAILSSTGETKFTYVTAVASLSGERAPWEEHPPFLSKMKDNPIKIWTFREMIHQIRTELKTTLAATEVGRLLQMFKAAKVDIGSN